MPWKGNFEITLGDLGRKLGQFINRSYKGYINGKDKNIAAYKNEGPQDKGSGRKELLGPVVLLLRVGPCHLTDVLPIRDKVEDKGSLFIEFGKLGILYLLGHDYGTVVFLFDIFFGKAGVIVIIYLVEKVVVVGHVPVGIVKLPGAQKNEGQASQHKYGKCDQQSFDLFHIVYPLFQLKIVTGTPDGLNKFGIVGFFLELFAELSYMDV